jgi:FdhE protein
MSDPTIQPDPSQIGGISQAPFVRLPDPASLFAQRSARFAMADPADPLAPYLAFLSALADAQDAVLAGLPDPAMPTEDAVARAREFTMPPLDRGLFKPDAALWQTFDRLFEALGPVPKPETAQAALAKVRAADPAALSAMVTTVLSSSIPAETMAEHIYIAAGLQVHFARMAARLDAKRLVPIETGICPACGGPPTSSMVVGWPGADGARYAFCSLCATLWNEVRIKCLVCGSTKGIGYRSLDGDAGKIKAECCDECGSYVKILYEHKDVRLDPVADDVASLGLDILLRDSTYRRGGFNPYLQGY